MIRYLKHTEIDKIKWDNCLNSSPQSLVYAQSWFLDITAPGWEALVDDDYSFIFPLTYRKKIGLNYLFQPPFVQQLGLFSNKENISEKKLNEFLVEIPGKFKLIEIQLNTSNTINHLNSYSIYKKITCHLPLSDSIEKIKNNYSENLLRNIKKARAAGIVISKNILPLDVIQLFRQNRGTGIENLKNKEYETLQKLADEAVKRNILDSLGVYNIEGKLIAGAFFLKSIHSYIFLFSATNEEAKEKGAMSLLIDSFISDHSGEERILDFEGSMDLNLARFYKSFGSKEIVYLQILKNDLPIFIRWLK